MNLPASNGFRISARTLFHLGAELISSDAVAFYELIKNAIDARSRYVSIAVNRGLPFGELERARAVVAQQIDAAQILSLAEQLRNRVDATAPHAEDLRFRLAHVRDRDALTSVLDDANYIVVEDVGSGMSELDLLNIYLTIGTPHRHDQKKLASGGAPILGEKGIGRLSTMRLGDRLEVRTATKADTHWNVLDIDWRWFEDPHTPLTSVPVSPKLGSVKDDPDASGTLLRISALRSEWSGEKLRSIAVEELAKLTDPFVTKTARYPIQLSFNGEPVPIPRFDSILFEAAHAVVRATYHVDGEPSLTGSVDYRLEGRRREISLSGAHLASAVAEVIEYLDDPKAKRSRKRKQNQTPIDWEYVERTLRGLGPLELVFYWFNRQRVRGLEGIGDQRAVRDLINEWTGGIKLYRDGFRVLPYGGPNDDWLQIDEDALARSGFKGNRRQIIGGVAITSERNPALQDQTNREGLRDTPEKRVLVGLLRYVYDKEFVNLLNEVANEKRKNRLPTLQAVEDRIQMQEDKLQQALRRLRSYPQITNDRDLIQTFESVIGEVREILGQARALGEAFEARTGDVINLAGIGLMVEVVTHELHRATTNTLVALGNVDLDAKRDQVEARLQTLQAQLQTLQKRISVLDPYTTSGRQQKTTFDLVRLIRDVLQTHEAQFARHGIAPRLSTPPGVTSVEVHAVKGMVVQIMENLISNSVYWLGVEGGRLGGGFEPEIEVEVRVDPVEVRFSDNGPGIPPSLNERVFLPFFSTKSSKRSQKGLGLYVSREIARYHGGDLYLDDAPGPHATLGTFVLTLAPPSLEAD